LAEQRFGENHKVNQLNRKMNPTTMSSTPLVWARGEEKKIALVALAMCVLAHLRRREMRKRWLGPANVDDKQCYPIVDHPAFGYLFENILCFGTAFAIDKYIPPVDKARPLRSLLIILARGWAMVNSSLIIEKIVASTIYSHVPYFSARKPAQDLWTIMIDYLRCNLPVEIVNSLLQLFVLYRLPDAKVNTLIVNPESLQLFPTIAKFMFCRMVVDITFGAAHRFMHENQWVYDNVHRLHHEHTAPRTQTNLHFTWLDQFIEAVLPIYVSFSALSALRMPPSRYEQTILAMPLLYYESCSHSGKEIPIVTWVPFLSPLVDWFTGCDQRLIEYHTRHHQLYRCNYSISPWWDKMNGTYRIDLPDSYPKEASYE
jgi:sterol desaturase/sphingolipid hydroxylase (fatty acid hydroxylase superfamily)